MIVISPEPIPPDTTPPVARLAINHLNSAQSPGVSLSGFAKSKQYAINCGPVGCENCQDGYKGRVGIYEVVQITPAIQRIIMEDGNSMQIDEVAQKEGFRNLRQSALMKAEQGVTSLAEVNRVTKD